MGLSRQTRMYGHLTLEGSHYLLSIPPTDTASPSAFSDESWFLSNGQHYHRPVGKAGVLHATSKPFLLLCLQKVQILWIPRLWTLGHLPLIPVAVLITSLSLSEDLSSSSQTCPRPLLCPHLQRCQYRKPWSLLR